MSASRLRSVGGGGAQILSAARIGAPNPPVGIRQEIRRPASGVSSLLPYRSLAAASQRLYPKTPIVRGMYEEWADRGGQSRGSYCRDQGRRIDDAVEQPSIAVHGLPQRENFKRKRKQRKKKALGGGVVAIAGGIGPRPYCGPLFTRAPIYEKFDRGVRECRSGGRSPSRRP